MPPIVTAGVTFKISLDVRNKVSGTIWIRLGGYEKVVYVKADEIEAVEFALKAPYTAGPWKIEVVAGHDEVVNDRRIVSISVAAPKPRAIIERISYPAKVGQTVRVEVWIVNEGGEGTIWIEADGVKWHYDVFP